MIKYLLTLFVFDISPGISFAVVARNVILSGSTKIGLFSALGVAASDGLSAILAFVGCDVILSTNKALFLFLKTLGLLYLFNICLKMFQSKNTTIETQSKNKSKITHKTAFYDGFIFTFSNPVVIISIAAILTQHLNSNMLLIQKIAILLCVPIVSFASFAIIAMGFSIPYMQKFLLQKNNIIDKISSVIIVILISREIPSIISGLALLTK